MMKMIPLTRGLVARVDDEDYDLVMMYKWCTHSSGYAVTNLPSRKQLLMHRLITNAPAGLEVDHRDFDRLNNTRVNLCVMTRHDNNKNRLPYKNNKSGFKGVTRQGDKWRATITVSSKHIHIGSFDTKETAAAAYDKAALVHFGKYARLNK